MNGTQFILNMWADGKDDPEMQEIAMECFQESQDIFMKAVEQEKEWATYLFSKGSMIGLNEVILVQYLEYITNVRMGALGLPKPFSETTNPIPWINNYLSTDAVQVAPQEVEITSYLVGQIDSKIDNEELGKFEL